VYNDKENMEFLKKNTSLDNLMVYNLSVTVKVVLSIIIKKKKTQNKTMVIIEVDE